MKQTTAGLAAAALASLTLVAGCAQGMSGMGMSGMSPQGMSDEGMIEMSASGPGMSLMTTPLAAKAGLEGATGMAQVDAPNGMVAISVSLPYALSTGVLQRQGNGNMYTGHFRIVNLLTPYGAVVVTLESDGNRGSYDPRPGTPVLQAMIN